MFIYDWLYHLGGWRSLGGISTRYGVDYHGDTDDDPKIETANLSTIYTCRKILCDLAGLLPLNVRVDGKNDPDHYISNKLERPNSYQGRESFMSQLEFHKNEYGNAFVWIGDAGQGKDQDFHIIPPEAVVDYKFVNGQLYYKFKWDYVIDKNKLAVPISGRKDEMKASEILHFKNIGSDVFSLSPMLGAKAVIDMQHYASNTVLSVFKNRGLPSLSLESNIDSAGKYKIDKEVKENFINEFTGSLNSGKVISLPPNSKLSPIQIKLAENQLIETLKFTRDEILSAHRIPSFMMVDSQSISNNIDIEQQMLSFKALTANGLTNSYEGELKRKLVFDSDKRKKRVELQFDFDRLLESDLKTKSQALGNLFTKGMMTLNEASDKLGTERVEGELGNLRIIQTQYIPLTDETMKPENHPLLQKDNISKPKDEASNGD